MRTASPNGPRKVPIYICPGFGNVEFLHSFASCFRCVSATSVAWPGFACRSNGWLLFEQLVASIAASCGLDKFFDREREFHPDNVIAEFLNPLL